MVATVASALPPSERGDTGKAVGQSVELPMIDADTGSA
jgi:hypothetical protein